MSVANEALPTPRWLRTLIWREWLVHGPLLTGFGAIWVTLLWVVPVMDHPLWIGGLGVVYAALVGTALGGGEATLGAEEFTFALPPTRSQRYRARLLLGGGELLLLTVVGVVAQTLNLPQRLWSGVVETGLTAPFVVPAFGWRYPLLAVGVPLAYFGWTFAVAAGATSRATVQTAWLAGALVVGFAAVFGVALESELSGGPALAALPLAVLGLGCLWVGHRVHVRTPGLNQPLPPSGRGGSWVWTLVVLGFVAAMWLVLLRGGSDAPEPEERHPTHELREGREKGDRR